MTNWFTLYGLLVLLSALAAAMLGAYAWQHRTMPGAKAAVAGYAGLAIWAPAYVLTLMSHDLSSALFWANVEFLGTVPLPVAWLVMILQYTRRERWLTTRRLALLCVIPLITEALVWTDGLHGLVFHDPYLATFGPLSILERSAGPWFWVHVAYSYAVGLANFALIGVALRQAPAVHRGQLLTLFAGALVPVAGSGFDFLNIWPMAPLELAPVLVGPGGYIMAWGLFRYRLFDLVPIAWHRVVEALGDGVIVLDDRGQIMDLNPAAQDIFGCTLSQVVGQKAELVLRQFAEVLEVSRQSSDARGEFLFATSFPGSNATTERQYAGQATPLFDRRGQLIGRAITLRDITERKRVEDALRASEQRYRDLADSLPETVFETDVGGKLTFANQSGLEKFGRSREEFDEGINVIDCIAPEDRQRALATLGQMVGGAPTEAREYAAIRKDGSRFPVVIASRAILRNGVPVGLSGFLVDITERKRMEEVLRGQQRSLVTLEERDRLARELHDSLGQVLGYINAQAQAVREVLSNGQTALADAHLVRLVEVVRDAYADVREYILSVKASSRQSLFRSLEQYLERFGPANGLAVELIVPDDLREGALSPVVESHLTRIIQEALVNIRKHARASVVKMAFSSLGDGWIEVVVEDDGRGFDLGEVAALGAGMFGLQIMQERAQEVGASVQVSSVPGRGTRVIIRAPMRTAAGGVAVQ